MAVYGVPKSYTLGVCAVSPGRRTFPPNHTAMHSRSGASAAEGVAQRSCSVCACLLQLTHSVRVDVDGPVLAL